MSELTIYGRVPRIVSRQTAGSLVFVIQNRGGYKYLWKDGKWNSGWRSCDSYATEAEAEAFIAKHADKPPERATHADKPATTEQRPQLIYLASPYSHDDTRIRDGRFREVCKWAARLMRMGHLIFSPIAHTHPIAMAGELPTGWDFWQKYDHAQLNAAAELWVLKLAGWDESKGVAGEIEYMKLKGRPIKYIDPVCEPTDDKFPHPEFFATPQPQHEPEQPTPTAPPAQIQTEEISLTGGDRKVEIKGDDELQIVDANGRQRHRSRGQMATGLHFAMALAKIPFESSELADRHLQYSARKFSDTAPPAADVTARDSPETAWRLKRFGSQFCLLDPIEEVQGIVNTPAAEFIEAAENRIAALEQSNAELVKQLGEEKAEVARLKGVLAWNEG